ncbi:MAG: DUF4252 domain-containing protein [Bacteroidota bacterium]
MKYLMCLLLSCFGLTLMAQNDAINKYFERYIENEDFSMVYISPKMFNLIAKLDIDDLADRDASAVVDVLKELKGLRVLSTEEEPYQHYKDALSIIPASEYELLLTVRDEGENVRFWMKEEGDIIKELLLLVGGEDEFVLVSFVGNIDLVKISRLARVLDIDGAEYLEKLDDDEKRGDD